MRGFSGPRPRPARVRRPFSRRPGTFLRATKSPGITAVRPMYTTALAPYHPTTTQDLHRRRVWDDDGSDGGARQGGGAVQQRCALCNVHATRLRASPRSQRLYTTHGASLHAIHVRGSPFRSPHTLPTAHLVDARFASAPETVHSVTRATRGYLGDSTQGCTTAGSAHRLGQGAARTLHARLQSRRFPQESP